MKVITTDKGELFIRWRYSTVPVMRNNEEVASTTQTECIASRESEIIATGVVRRFHLDIENREEARKRSLEALLNELYPLEKPTKEEKTDMAHAQLQQHLKVLKDRNAPKKVQRSLFWDAYNSRKDIGSTLDIDTVASVLVERYGKEELLEALSKIN